MGMCGIVTALMPLAGTYWVYINDIYTNTFCIKLFNRF